MIRPLILVLAALCACGPQVKGPARPAAPPSWALALAGPGHSAGAAIAIGPDGDLFAAATFEGQVRLGEAMIAAAGGSDVLLARLRPDGAVVWAQPLGGEADDRAAALAVTPAGQVAIAATFAGEATIGPTLHRARGAPDSVIALLDGDGSARWARPLSSTDYAQVTDLAAAPDGSLIAVGLFAGTMRVGDVVLTSAGGQDGFVVRLASDGAVRWAVRFGGEHADGAAAVAVSADRIAVAGTFTVQADFGGVPLDGDPRSQDAFVAMLDGDGKARWVRRMGGEGNDTAAAVALGVDQRLYVAGTFQGSAEIAGRSLLAEGAADAYVAAFGAGGEPAWAVRFGGPGTVLPRRLRVTGDEVLVGGSFDRQIQAGDRGLRSAGGHDLFAAALDLEGQTRWARALGGPGQDELVGLAVTDAGGVAVTGTFSSTVALDGITLESRGPATAFFAWLRR